MRLQPAQPAPWHADTQIRMQVQPMMDDLHSACAAYRSTHGQHYEYDAGSRTKLLGSLALPDTRQCSLPSCRGPVLLRAFSQEKAKAAQYE